MIVTETELQFHWRSSIIDLCTLDSGCSAEDREEEGQGEVRGGFLKKEASLPVLQRSPGIDYYYYYFLLSLILNLFLSTVSFPPTFKLVQASTVRKTALLHPASL